MDTPIVSEHLYQKLELTGGETKSIVILKEIKRII